MKRFLATWRLYLRLLWKEIGPWWWRMKTAFWEPSVFPCNGSWTSTRKCLWNVSYHECERDKEHTGRHRCSCGEAPPRRAKYSPDGSVFIPAKKRRR